MLCIPAIQAAREAARRQSSINNLKQIGLALHNYHDTFGRLPPGGTFQDDGAALHGWPTLIVPFLEASPFYNRIDLTTPWDDSKQIDAFLQWKWRPYLDPGVSQQETDEGVPVIHYAANEWLMNRHEGVRFEDIANTRRTLLIADAFGEFRPAGDAFHWRDPTVPFRTSPRQFGSVARTVTLVAFVDGHVEEICPEIDADVFAQLTGPPELRPSPDAVERPTEPYRLKTRENWRLLFVDGKMDRGVRFSLSPNGHYLEAIFADYLPSPADPKTNWQTELDSFVKSRPIGHVRISGTLYASELEPILQIPTLKRLSLDAANIHGDKEAVLRKARPTIKVD